MTYDQWLGRFADEVYEAGQMALENDRTCQQFHRRHCLGAKRAAKALMQRANSPESTAAWEHQYQTWAQRSKA